MDFIGICLEMKGFWNMSLCRWVCCARRFEEMSCPCFRESNSIKLFSLDLFIVENKGITFLRNVGHHTNTDKASYMKVLQHRTETLKKNGSSSVRIAIPSSK
jgi:hypothetical protein